jgi:ribosomal-protein-alanine N-acetyltransferase
VELKLANISDAAELAAMSRDLVEAGLGWAWTPSRVARNIRSPDNIVLAANQRQRIVGFAIMYFGREEARLNLLAVRPDCRRAGVGRRLIQWLEASALVAGISVVYLELRAANPGARAFYEKLGYRRVDTLPGYYSGRESALRMARDLWSSTFTPAT